MKTKKTELIQIRVEPELLGRFKNMCEKRELELSALLRHLMKCECKDFDEYLKRNS
jgi:hypothetical protein